jgi:L-fuconolactonase
MTESAGAPQEEVLDPERPIVDPHHHLWDFAANPYLLEQLHEDTGSGHNVTHTVFVECTWGYRTGGPEVLRPVGETEHVAATAERSATTAGATVAGIVSFADLTLGAAVEDVLAAHAEAGGGRFRGIRHASSWDADPKIRNAHTDPTPDLLSRSDFREGFATLARLGHSFDAWMYHPQLPALVDLARAHPEVSIVLDHLGGPVGIGPYAGRREEVLAAWRPVMAEIARCPNVSLKVGGIGMSLFGFDFHRRPGGASSEELARAWGDEIRWCIDAFGPDRCMFESNFPVDKVSASYRVLWNAFKRIAADAGYGPADSDALFGGTATRVYRLDGGS